MTESNVRVAAAQVTPVFFDRDATVAKAVSVIEEAGRNGAELVAFPETWIPGYPMWIYGAAGWDDPVAGRSRACRPTPSRCRAPRPTCSAPPRAGPE